MKTVNLYCSLVSSAAFETEKEKVVVVVALLSTIPLFTMSPASRPVSSVINARGADAKARAKVTVNTVPVAERLPGVVKFTLNAESVPAIELAVGVPAPGPKTTVGVDPPPT